MGWRSGFFYQPLFFCPGMEIFKTGQAATDTGGGIFFLFQLFLVLFQAEAVEGGVKIHVGTRQENALNPIDNF